MTARILVAFAATAVAADSASAQFPRRPVFQPTIQPALFLPVQVPAVSPVFIPPPSTAIGQIVDPFTGTVTRYGTTVDPFSGATIQQAAQFNPLTGTTITNKTLTDPFTGTVLNRQTAENPQLGVYRSTTNVQRSPLIPVFPVAPQLPIFPR